MESRRDRLNFCLSEDGASYCSARIAGSNQRLSVNVRFPNTFGAPFDASQRLGEVVRPPPLNMSCCGRAVLVASLVLYRQCG